MLDNNADKVWMIGEDDIIGSDGYRVCSIGKMLSRRGEEDAEWRGFDR